MNVSNPAHSLRLMRANTRIRFSLSPTGGEGPWLPCSGACFGFAAWRGLS